MGGVVAVVNFDGAPVDPAVLRRMAEQCAYRGPDGIQYWIKGNVGLAHLALHATQESLRESMPMLSADGRLVLTADARVDNRPELIEALRAKGQPFPADPTDADLILAAYQCWGETCPEQIIGDYGFIIWDDRKQRLFCARDVYGVKSLHYTRHGALLCVASEAQMIIQHPVVPRALDEIAVADFLVRNYNDEGRTMFKDVWAVKRAHSLAADANGQNMTRYWDIDPNYRITYPNDADYAAKFLEIFTRCVSDRLRTPEGTNIGITMSGGLDSTSVAAVAQKLLNERPGSPHLMAATYAFETLKECDETEYSKAMADELGIDLTYIPAENFWYLDDDEAFTPSLETPFMAGESITNHILGIFQNRQVCIWLTGHGGDSMLKGNTLVYADRLVQGDLSCIQEIATLCKQNEISFLLQVRIFWNLFFWPLVPDLPWSVSNPFHPKKIPDWLTSDFVHRTRLMKRLIPIRQRKIFFERARQANYMQAIKIDPIQATVSWTTYLAAKHNLEVRHPFLDRRLIQYLLAIPQNNLSSIGFTKLILRESLCGILPEIVRNRIGKTEFSTYKAWGIRVKEINKIRKIFSSPTFLRKLKILDLGRLICLLKRYISSGNRADGNNLWVIVCVEYWLYNYYSVVNC